MLTVVGAISILGPSGLVAQSDPVKVVAEFSGASLKWIRIAEPEFQRRKLDLDKYVVRVEERSDSVTVDLRLVDASIGAKGSSGSYPGFEVEISKKDLKAVRSNYVK
jgi:hypothetical protein